MALDDVNKKQNDPNKELTEQIRKIMREEIKSYFDDKTEENNYEILEDWNKKAVEKIKKDLSDSIQRNDSSINSEKLKKKSQEMDKMVDKIIGLIEQIREDERKKGHDYSNPLTESTVFRYFPWLKSIDPRKKRGTSNWLGLFMTGIGLTFIGRGIWDASGELFSIQGSILIGSFILALVAWLERRKIFSLFGQE